ncbi:MAG: diguanylate cyclase [Nitriliruptorales bacterium]
MRLTLYFTLVVVLPVLVAALVAGLPLFREIERRSERDLALATQAVLEQVELVRSRADDAAADLVAPDRPLGDALEDRDAATAQAVLDGLVLPADRADVVVVGTPEGEVLASRVRPPELASRGSPATVDELALRAAEGTVDPRVLGTVRPVESLRGEPLGFVLSGRWVDDRLARDLQGQLPVELTLAVDGGVVGDTAEEALEGRAERTVEVSGWTVTASVSRAHLGASRRLVLVGLGVLVLTSAIAAAALGWLSARLVVQPLQELASAAREVTAGDLDRRIEVAGEDEIATLGGALNAVTAALRDRLRDLEVSRDALQRSLDRIGQTLGSSLDLRRTLESVVDASAEALSAERAALYMLDEARSVIVVEVGQGLSDDELTAEIPVGDGFVGWICQVGAGVRLPADADVIDREPAPGEPHATAMVAAPLFRPGAGAVIGILALFDRTDDRVFTDRDHRTLRSFAVQASVAIDNVHLHEAAQQASVTDELTGLWNHRYFRQRVQEEVERANRFGHELGLALLDIDHFKDVNDRFGHPAGDDVLVEVSRRITAQLREVDTVARYGGEEIVLVLPETDLDGARRSAERVREVVSGSPIHADGHDLTVTVSLGVAVFPRHARSLEDLVRQADRALYAAKEGGRDRVVVATPAAPGTTVPSS